MHTTPASLLDQLRRSRDESAWGQFVALYTPLLLYWARRAGFQDHDAVDIVQDVFTILVRKLPDFQYDPSRSFRSWLRTILLNRCRSRYQERSRSAVVDIPLPDHLTVADEAAIFTETEYRDYLLARALELMQSEFEPTTWKAWWELLINQRSAAEVAAELGITRNAVYLAKARVLSRLRRGLEGLLD